MSTVIYDGTFPGSATSAGGAGTTTGVADSASVGSANSWTDMVGGAYHIDGSHRATHNPIGAFSSNTILTRPDAEACNDHSFDVRWTWNGSDLVYSGPILRRNGNNWYWVVTTAYNAGGTSNNTFNLYKVVGGSLTVIQDSVPTGYTWVSGHDYRVVTKATGFSPTSLTVEVYDLSSGSPGTPVASHTFTDSTSQLQTAGTCGWHGWDTFGTMLASRIIINNETTSSPATGYSLTGPSTCTVGSPSSNFTVTLTPNGGTSAGVTITPSDGGGGGTFSPSTVSLSTGTPSATFTYTAASAGVKTISASNNGGLSNPSSLSVTASVAALTMGALSVSARTSTSITVGWSAATNGTGSKTYSLYRHPSAPFAPPGTGTHVGDTTSTSLTDNSPGMGDVYYRVVVTDGASSTATSTQSPDQGALLTRVLLSPIVIGLIGDSITANMGSASGFISTLAAQEPRRSVSLGSNQGIGGTTSTDWVSGSANLNNAIAAFTTAGVTHVCVMLGTNDAKTGIATSTSTYTSNVAGIAAACVAAGFKVLLNSPLYVVPGSYGQWDEAANVRLMAYRDALASLANGTTIFSGDVDLFDAISNNSDAYLSDGVHPNNTGNTLIWNRWATL